MEEKKTAKKSNRLSWCFLSAVAAAYFAVYLIIPSRLPLAFEFLYKLSFKLMPVFALVFAVMVIVDLFLTPGRIIKYIGGEAGIKKWLFVIAGGILSTGPIYIWYPLLADLQKKGVRSGLLAVFLYNRAIKLPYIPLLLAYFSWTFVLLMTGLMIAASVAQGIFINWADKKC